MVEGGGGSGEDSLGCRCAKMGDGAMQLDDVATDSARSSTRILPLQRSQFLQFFARALAIASLAQFLIFWNIPKDIRSDLVAFNRIYSFNFKARAADLQFRSTLVRWNSLTA